MCGLFRDVSEILFWVLEFWDLGINIFRFNYLENSLMTRPFNVSKHKITILIMKPTFEHIASDPYNHKIIRLRSDVWVIPNCC